MQVRSLSVTLPERNNNNAPWSRENKDTCLGLSYVTTDRLPINRIRLGNTFRGRPLFPGLDHNDIVE